MKREAQAVVFIVIGAVLLKLVISGEYANYVRSILRPYLILAGLVLITLGVVGFVRDWRGRGAIERAQQFAAEARIRTHGPGSEEVSSADDQLRAAVDVEEDGSEAHAGQDHEGHAGGGLGHAVGWLWIIPVFVLVLVPPPALGSFAAERGAVTVPEPAPGLKYPALTGADPINMEVNDYARRAVWNKGKTLTGHTIRLAGFVTPHNGGSWYLTRMKVSCCAADARPYQVQIDGYGKALPRDTWVEVVGVWEPSTGSDQTTQVPRLKVSVVDIVNTPRQPYE